ncbi:MAG TPA: hypothetical protein VND15_03160 [Candidatus Acidoferrales bacterium]|nr:hypothetical protein [Candidatus Acidoferrales bacterium]
MSDNRMAMPGERLATEEEFVPGENTYVEEGVIFASAIGPVTTEGGKISVSQAGRKVRIVERDMVIIGTVTESAKSVLFVRIDDMNIDGKQYIAIKDGKILTKPKGPGGPRFRGRPERGAPPEEGHREREEAQPARPCNIGDTVIARVQFNDKDSYQLTMDRPETGVIRSRCGVCGGELLCNEQRTQLTCTECGHDERRKISSLYNKSEEIKRMFA